MDHSKKYIVAVVFSALFLMLVLLPASCSGKQTTTPLTTMTASISPIQTLTNTTVTATTAPNLTNTTTTATMTQTVVPTPTEASSYNISIDGDLSDWPPTTISVGHALSVTSGNTTAAVAILKTVYALMDSNYLYVAMQIYGTFATSPPRNYFISLDFNNDQQQEYRFGFRDNGLTWVFDYTKDQNNPTMENTKGVVAAAKNDTIEAEIPRGEYGIPTAINIASVVCDATNGQPIDQIGWFPIQLAWIGIETTTVDTSTKAKYGLSVDKGAVVLEVIPGAPADKAGLKVYDVIVKFAGKDISKSEDLFQALGSASIGQPVDLTYYRGSDQLTTTITPSLH